MPICDLGVYNKLKFSLSLKAMAIITVTCPNLVKLGLHNCEFEEEQDLARDDPFRCVFFATHCYVDRSKNRTLLNRNADRILRAEKWQTVQKLVMPLLDLEVVRIITVIPEKNLVFLLSQCINVKEIFMGMTTDISDGIWSQVLAKNSLQNLEKIKIQRCSDVNIHSITQFSVASQLFLHC